MDLAEMRIGGTTGDPSLIVPTSRTISTTAPLQGGGDLSADRTLSITQATAGTDGYLTATDWTTFNSKLSNPLTTTGDIIYSSGGSTAARLAIGSIHKVLHSDGTVPRWENIDESDLFLSDVTTNNASTAKHGLLPKLSGNADEYLNGAGNWSTPAASAVVAYTSTTFSGQTSVNVVHNFGQYPAVQVLDGTGAIIIPQSIVHNTQNDFTVTFSLSTSGTIISTIGSPGAQKVVAVNDDYTVLSTDRIVKVTASGKDITLPTAVGATGREYVIDNASSGNITLLPDGSELIEGESSQILPSDSAIHVYSDGTGWRIY